MTFQDSLLWNRLGATLGKKDNLDKVIQILIFTIFVANGGRSEEAVEAYYKALEISPDLFVHAIT